jgi:hypothetical protein
MHGHFVTRTEVDNPSSQAAPSGVSARSEWEPFHAFWPRRLEDGSRTSGLLARRRIGGEWIYRKPSPAEEALYVAEESW